MARKSVKSIVVSSAITGAMIVFAFMEVMLHIDRLRKLVEDNSLPEVENMDTNASEDIEG